MPDDNLVGSTEKDPDEESRNLERTHNAVNEDSDKDVNSPDPDQTKEPSHRL